MSVIRIRGLQRLQGKIRIQGSKNAVLPVMAAAVLHSGVSIIKNVPQIQDVFCMMEILETLGCRCRLEGHVLEIDTRSLSSSRVLEKQGRRMRSSVMLLGPLLGRLHEAKTCHPGGCSIGKRPVDLHLQAFRQMGAQIREEGEQIAVSAVNLMGTEIILPFPSVGATENILMAAVMAEGITCICGAAREPEIQVLCDFLKAMGAQIYGSGTGILTVYGKKKLQDVEFTVPGDRIVAGTYLGAVMTAGGELCLAGVPTEHMEQTLAAAEKAGCCLRISAEEICARMDGRPLPVELNTGPYPEFPTDMQSVMLSVTSIAMGSSRIQENIFEERFATVGELQKMGAHIIIERGTALVRGRYPLQGTAVRAPDLRGGAALVLAGLAAEGESRVEDCFYILRGYEDICRDLSAVGAALSMEEE